jgi:hypothetical protein
VLLEKLGDCLDLMYQDPRQPGLNLETLHTNTPQPVLSARIDRSNRLILTPLPGSQVGLLYFDKHDEAYDWVRRQGQRLGTLLSKQREAPRGTRFSFGMSLVPVVRSDEDSEIALASAAQFRQMLDNGVGRYLTYLDDDQRRLAELRVSSLLLVKGGAGTGKTAVAIHRLLNLARQPVLVGPSRCCTSVTTLSSRVWSANWSTCCAEGNAPRGSRSARFMPGASTSSGSTNCQHQLRSSANVARSCSQPVLARWPVTVVLSWATWTRSISATRSPTSSSTTVLKRVSGRRESHPPALVELSVSLSTHSAPIVQPSGRARRQWANSVVSRRAMRTSQRCARLVWPRSRLYFRLAHRTRYVLMRLRSGYNPDL